MGLKKFEINYSEIEHYRSTEIEAMGRGEALEIFEEMKNNGDIPVVNSNYHNHTVKEIKN